MIYKILLFIGVIFNVTAQTLLKFSMTKAVAVAEASPLKKILSTVFQPLFLLSILAYGIGFGLYAVSLSKLELSRAYPISSIAALLLITVVSLLLFNEAFSVTKIIGLLVCIAGIILIFL
jgi:undecaprenyl phosphate-alpha-L-ara4N flippase subunit ArnF